MEPTMIVELSTRKDGALGSHTLHLPLTPDAFDTALCMAGIYTGSREEYKITGVRCAYPELERMANWANELDELNFLAEQWIGFSQRDAERLLGLVTATGGGIINTVNLTQHYAGITFHPEIGSLEELGRQYLEKSDRIMPDGQEYSVNPFLELEYGKVMQKKQHGVFYGDGPYYASLPLSYLTEPYTGHILPCDLPEKRDCLRAFNSHHLINFQKRQQYDLGRYAYGVFDSVKVRTNIALGINASQVCRTATRIGCSDPFILEAQYNGWEALSPNKTIYPLSELAHQLRQLSEEEVSSAYTAIMSRVRDFQTDRRMAHHDPEELLAKHQLLEYPELQLPDTVRADPRVELLLCSLENELVHTKLVLPQEDPAALDEAAERLWMVDRHSQGYYVKSLSLSPGSGVMEEILRSCRQQGEIPSLDVLQEVYLDAVLERPDYTLVDDEVMEPIGPIQ